MCYLSLFPVIFLFSTQGNQDVESVSEPSGGTRIGTGLI